MKKFFRIFMLIFIILPVCFVCSACGEENMDAYKIVSVAQTSFNTESVTYTITYADGSTLDYTVPNSTVSISSIEKTSSDYNKDIYTITLTNGAQTTFEVKNGVSVQSIQYNRTVGLKDYYKITYSNGLSDEISITNGKDGTDGVTLDDIYESINSEREASGLEPYENMSDFIADYLTFNTSSTSLTVATGKALLSTVSVYSRRDTLTPVYSKDLGRYVNIKSFSAGAGVIYSLDKTSGDAYIITNCHVVYDATEGYSDTVYCFLYGMDDDLPYSYVTKEDNSDYEYEQGSDGQKWVKIELSEYAIPCEVIGASIKYDIAVLKINNNNILKSSNAIQAEVNNSDDVVVGENALAVGNPNSGGISATAGIISVISEYIQVEIDGNVESVLREFRIDTAVNPGNSGGGLYDKDGKLIGIVNAKTSSTSLENFGYAIPSNIAKFLADNMIYNHENNDAFGVNRVLVGITLDARSSYSRYNIDKQTAEIVEEVEVYKLQEYYDELNTRPTLAKQMGLKVGDIIKSVRINDGEEKVITRTFQLTDYMLNARLGDTIYLTVMTTTGEETYSSIITSDNMKLEE